MPNPQNLRPPWKPGQSGNPGGRPKGRSCTAILNRILDEEAKVKGQASGHGITNREVLVRQLFGDTMKTGHPALYRLLMDLTEQHEDLLDRIKVLEDALQVATDPAARSTTVDTETARRIMRAASGNVGPFDESNDSSQ